MKRRLVAGTAALAAALVTSIGISAWSGGRDEPSGYVAMGDSYSSGDGIAPLVPSADPRCSRSRLNYAHLIERRTEVVHLTDVTCTGARTDHFETAQHPGVPPQLRALSEHTELVTMTIGVNDGAVFGRSINTCAGLSPTDRTGDPCRRELGSVLRRHIAERTAPDVVRALTQVRRAAPNARIAVVGYPRILPATGSAECTTATAIAQGDVAYLNSVMRDLNRALRRGAQQVGVTYVDMWQVSEGHDACQATGTRWIEPSVPLNAAPFHPNARGEAAMADEVIRALGLQRT